VARKGVAAGAVFVVLLVGAITVGFVSKAIPLELPTRVVGPPVCEGLDSAGLQFKAKTRGVRFTAITEANEGRGIVYRRMANTNSDLDVVGRLLPANCQVGFVGFCIGEALPELTSPNAPQDQQWFILPDNRGYVHGGVVQELPPGTIEQEPSTCDGGRPEPRELRSVGALPAELTAKTSIELSAPGAVTVAAAVYAADVDGVIEWRPLAMDIKASDKFLLVLNPANLAPQAGATLLLTVCWAGNVPGRAQIKSTISIGTGNPAAPQASTPDPRQGASVACKQVAGGS
jgi:hypothetical protein